MLEAVRMYSLTNFISRIAFQQANREITHAEERSAPTGPYPSLYGPNTHWLAVSFAACYECNYPRVWNGVR